MFFKKRWHLNEKRFLWMISPFLITVTLIPMIIQFVWKQSSSQHAVSISLRGEKTNKSWNYMPKPKCRFLRIQFCSTTNVNSSKWKEMGKKNTNEHNTFWCEGRKKMNILTVSFSIIVTIHIEREWYRNTYDCFCLFFQLFISAFVGTHYRVR